MKFPVVERAPKAAPTLEQIVRDYLNAKDEAEGAREGQIDAGRLARLRQDAEAALRRAVTR